MLVEKKVFELPRYTTRGGALLRNVRIGWESYGRLNRDRSNAILVTHYFSATSHAAGRYAADDALPGYWDAIIGPGKAIDTDKYFVVSADTLANLNVKSPLVGTAGPATINPDTGTFFVLSSDTLVNLNARDPNVVTTGPASIDPETGRRYGMSSRASASSGCGRSPGHRWARSRPTSGRCRTRGWSTASCR